MSKSYWIKEQKGNFSNEKKDTFDKKKRYVGIRLQQGVPLLDRDWNEKEDIRRYEEEMLHKWYIGNGTPDDGFKISACRPPKNDFEISAGRCMVDGLEAVNEPENGEYILYSEQEGVEELSPTVARKRTDRVYLDVWIEEVTKEEDDSLGNPQDIGVETCVRHCLKWRVRVERQGQTHAKEEFHRYYDIAVIKRAPNRNTILDSEIEDSRNTNLALHHLRNETDSLLNNSIADGLHKHSKLVGADGSPDPALSVDNSGNVGIRTEVPKGRLDISSPWGDWIFLTQERATQGGGGFHIHNPWGNDHGADRNALNISYRTSTGENKWGQFVLHGPTGNVGIGTGAPKNKLDVEGGAVIGSAFSGSKTAPTDGLLVQGNVGIGTTVPGTNLHIHYHSQPQLRISDNNGYWQFWGGSNLHIREANSDRFFIKKGGNVGIGTGAPKNKLDVEGGAVIGSTFSGSKTAPTDGLLVQGNVGIRTEVPKGRLDISSPWGDWIFLTQERTTQGGGGFHIHNPWRNDDGPNRNALNISYRTSTGENKWGQFVLHGPTGNVGIGTGYPGNDKLDVRGRCYSSGGWHFTNADYAEYFESDNGSAIPVATSCTITKDGKVRRAKKGEIPVGITTTNSGLVGNSYKEWPKQYLRDEFSNLIMEEYKEEIMVPKKKKVKKERQEVKKKKITEEVKRTDIILKKGKYCQKEIKEKVISEVDEPVFKEVDLYDVAGKKKIGKHKIPVLEIYEEEVDVLDEDGQPVLVGSGKFETKERPKLNPKYNESKEYVPRENRPEWNCVGLLGQIPLRKGQPVASSWIKIKDVSKKVELWLVK